jgi:hypothetical protein
MRTDLQRLKRDTDSTRVAAAAADAGVKPARKIGWTALMGTMVVVVLALGGWLLFLRKARPLTDKGTIVLADFTNTTGDAIFRWHASTLIDTNYGRGGACLPRVRSGAAAHCFKSSSPHPQRCTGNPV